MTTSAIIPAGGFARRIGCGYPKSLIRISGIPLITLTAGSIAQAGVDRIIVVTDRPEWYDETIRALSEIRGARVVLDVSRENTYEVARTFAAHAGERVMFAYGHAPMPVSYVRTLLSLPNDLAFSISAVTSKRRPCHVSDFGFVEPPFVLPRQLLMARQELGWPEFVSKNFATASLLPLPAPPEFNELADFRLYEGYARRLARTCDWRGVRQRNPVTKCTRVQGMSS